MFSTRLRYDCNASMRIAFIAVFVVVIVVVAMVYFSGGRPSGIVDAGPGLLAGAPAQSFALRRSDGTSDALQNYRGRIVYVNLWATWCPPCRHEMPALERFYNEYRARGVTVLGMDQGEDARVVKTFLRAHGITYPNMLDSEQQYGRAYNAVGLPTTIIVDRGGRIVRGFDGEMSSEQMRAFVRPLIAKK